MASNQGVVGSNPAGRTILPMLAVVVFLGDNQCVMPNLEFSYRPLLQELTAVVNDRGFDPYEAYGWLYEKQAALYLTPQTYLSSSITSGGHARDETLEMKEVISRNTESARILAEQLATDGQIQPESAVEPVFVGKTHWNQAEFMEFWLSVIGGYQLTPGFIARDVDNLRSTTHEAFRAKELDVGLMISKESAVTRAPEYFKMSNAFADLITAGMDATPMDTVVRMIDTDMSLGAQTERAFARHIGTKVMKISVVRPAQPQDLEQVNSVLAEDTARLIRFGATVFDTSNNNVRLMLTEAAA